MGALFEANDASTAWASAARAIIEPGEAQIQASRVGQTRELLHAMFVINDPRQRWVVSRRIPINPAFAIAEVVWILSGRNDAAFLNFWNSQLAKYAGTDDVYHGAYGFRLRHHFGLDQLERAYQALSENPDSRQVALQIWDARVDLPTEDGKPQNSDIPCNVVALLKVRDNKLEWMQVMRSNDLHRGTPYNFIQWTSVQEVLAGWLGVEVGSYNHLSDSLHIYKEDIDRAYPARTIEAAPNRDSLRLDKSDSDGVIAEMSALIGELASADLTINDLRGLVDRVNLPSAYHNMLLVIAAEAARRHKWIEEAERLMAKNTNPVLQQAWSLWTKRFF